MSFELLVLLAVLVLLPLIERLLAAARARDPLAPPDAAQPRPDPTAGEAPRVPAREGLRPGSAVRRLPPASAPEAPDAESRPRRSVPATAGPRARTRRPAAATCLHNRVDLGRAMVLMAVLGPCRAVNPHDWPVGSERP